MAAVTIEMQITYAIPISPRLESRFGHRHFGFVSKEENKKSHAERITWKTLTIEEKTDFSVTKFDR